MWKETIVTKNNSIFAAARNSRLYFGCGVGVVIHLHHFLMRHKSRVKKVGVLLLLATLWLPKNKKTPCLKAFWSGLW